jgi:hypothetical protein
MVAVSIGNTVTVSIGDSECVGIGVAESGGPNVALCCDCSVSDRTKLGEEAAFHVSLTVFDDEQIPLRCNCSRAHHWNQFLP